MKQQIILIGGGGHASSIIDSIQCTEQFDIVGIIDKKEKVGTYIQGIKVVGEDRELELYYKNGIHYGFISIGSIGNVRQRKQIYLLLKKIGYKIPNIIDSTAYLSRSALLGEGNYIGKHAIINAGTVIKNGCILNTGCIIEHHCMIEDFVHVAPGSVVCGGVHIGAKTHIGANSTIIQGRTIGHSSLIGAGSVVVKDIQAYQKAYGNPCREVRNIEPCTDYC